MKPVLILILLSMALLTAALSQWPEVVGTLTAASLAVLLWVAAYIIVLVASGAAAWKHNARQVQRAPIAMGVRKKPIAHPIPGMAMAAPRVVAVLAFDRTTSV